MGLMFSFAAFFPQSKMMIFPLPVPLPARMLGRCGGALCVRTRLPVQVISRSCCSLCAAAMLLAYEVWATQTRSHDGVGHSAHIGGALGGILGWLILRRRI